MTSTAGLPLHSQRYAIVLGLGCSVFGVVMGGLVHHVGATLDWRVITLGRALVALVLAWAVARRSGVALTLRGTPAMWARSLAGASIMAASFYSFTVLPASDVVTLLNTTPIWLTVLSWAVLGHRPRAGGVAAVLVTLAGVVLVERPHLGSDHAWVVVLALVASGGMAVVTLILSRLRSVPAPRVVAHFVFVSLVTMCIALALPLEGRPTLAELSAVAPGVWAGLVGVGVSGALSQLLYTKACQVGRSTRVAVASVAQVPLAFAIDVAFGVREIDATSVLGIVLVCVPVILLLLRPTESVHEILEPLDATAAPPPRHAADATLRAAITRFERDTSCEIRVEVDPTPEPALDVAVRRFAEARMRDTARRNALLLLVWTRSSTVALIADEGVSDVVTRRSLVRALRSAPGTSWVEAVDRALAALAVVVRSSFPHLPGDVNELPDEVQWGPP